MRIVAVAALVVLALHQQPPARDTRQPREATGTGVIRGHVVAADTGQPIRRASVSLQYTPPVPSSGTTAAGATTVVIGGTMTMTSDGGPGVFLRPRQTQTDQSGGFEFTQLPAGTYRIVAQPPQFSGQYIAMAYGATKPTGDPGKPFDLSDGQAFDRVTIALPKGGVIAGHVTDDSGLPLARVQVYPLLYMPGSSRGARTSGGSTTDDRGEFRIFGLSPGDYAVVAEARQNTFVPPNAPVATVPDDDRTGFLTTYYPGTADEAAAQRVKVAAARETTGLEIHVLTGRLYRIAGTVVDSQGQPVAGANGMLTQRTLSTPGFQSSGFSTDPQGRFQMQNIAGGEYRLVVRQRPQGPPVNGQPPEPGEMAMVPLSVGGADIENLVIATAPGATITGHVTFEPMGPDTTGQPRPPLRIAVTSPNPMGFTGLPTPPPAQVQADQSFTLKGLMGEFVLRVVGLQPNWYMKSATVGGDDVIDTARAFRPGDDVSIVVSTRAGTLDGTVTDDKGQPAPDMVVLMFGEDKITWSGTSVWTRRATTTPKGQFHLTGLRPGHYLIVAAPRERTTGMVSLDPSFYEGLARDATTVVINEDEQRTIDLRVASGG